MLGSGRALAGFFHQALEGRGGALATRVRWRSSSTGRCVGHRATDGVLVGRDEVANSVTERMLAWSWAKIGEVEARASQVAGLGSWNSAKRRVADFVLGHAVKHVGWRRGDWLEDSLSITVNYGGKLLYVALCQCSCLGLHPGNVCGAAESLDSLCPYLQGVALKGKNV